MDDGEQVRWRRALAVANGWFRRRTDRLTRDAREDLAQQTALELWQFMRRHRCLELQTAVLVTIAYRLRCRAVKLGLRRVDHVAEGDLTQWPGQALAPDPTYRVDGRLVPRAFLLTQLDSAMHELGAANRQILMAFYEGFSCAEIGERFRLTEDAVKVRLHRTRARLKKRLEGSARAAGHFEA